MVDLCNENWFLHKDRRILLVMGSMMTAFGWMDQDFLIKLSITYLNCFGNFNRQQKWPRTFIKKKKKNRAIHAR